MTKINLRSTHIRTTICIIEARTTTPISTARQFCTINAQIRRHAHQAWRAGPQAAGT